MYTLSVGAQVCFQNYIFPSTPVVRFVNPPSNPKYVSVVVAKERVNIIWTPPAPTVDANVEMYDYNIYLLDKNGSLVQNYSDVRFLNLTNERLGYSINDTAPQTHYQLTVRSVYKHQEGDVTSSKIVRFFTEVYCQYTYQLENGYIINMTSSGTIVYTCLEYYYMDNAVYAENGYYDTACGVKPPECQPIPCDVIAPSDSATEVTMSFDNRSAIILCDDGFELDLDTLNVEHMTTQCVDGMWAPAVAFCRQISSCSLPYVGNASLTITGINKQLREGAVAEFDCEFGYKMDGNPVVTCVNSAWMDLPECPILRCINPNQAFYDKGGLIHGNSTTTHSSDFVHGDRVRMVCNIGHYQKTTYDEHEAELQNLPLEEVLRLLDQLSVYDCVAGNWQPIFQAQDCTPLMTETGFQMYLDHSEVYVSQALPVISQKYLNYYGQLFCSQHGSLFSHYINGNTVICSHEKRLWNGPDMYQGFVQVKLFNQWETVCPADSPSQVKMICNAFGFDASWSSFVVEQTGGDSSNKTISCPSSTCSIQAITSMTSCKNMIRCRRRCDVVYDVHAGHGCSNAMYEGDKCYQSCNHGGNTGMS